AARRSAQRRWRAVAAGRAGRPRRRQPERERVPRSASPAESRASRRAASTFPAPARSPTRSSWSCSGKPLELVEARLPSLQQSVLAFLALLRHVEGRRRVTGELLEPRLAVAVGVERGLEATQRDRAVVEHFA